MLIGPGSDDVVQQKGVHVVASKNYPQYPVQMTEAFSVYQNQLSANVSEKIKLKKEEEVIITISLPVHGIGRNVRDSDRNFY